MKLRQGSIVKKSPCQVEQSHSVTLSEAKGLSRSAARSFASLRMTGLDLAGGEELSSAFEPCLNKLTGRAEQPAKADKSAPTGIWGICLKPIIGDGHGVLIRARLSEGL